jgi:hypothetical protein
MTGGQQFRLSNMLLVALFAAAVLHEAPAVAGKECSATVVEIAQPAQRSSAFPPGLSKPSTAPILEEAGQNSRRFANVPVIESAIPQESAARTPFAVTRYGAAQIGSVRSSSDVAAKTVASDAPKVDGVSIVTSAAPARTTCN